jgi:hypothetical protein
MPTNPAISVEIARINSIEGVRTFLIQPRRALVNFP